MLPNEGLSCACMLTGCVGEWSWLTIGSGFKKGPLFSSRSFPILSILKEIEGKRSEENSKPTLPHEPLFVLG